MCSAAGPPRPSSIYHTAESLRLSESAVFQHLGGRRRHLRCRASVKPGGAIVVSSRWQSRGWKSASTFNLGANGGRRGRCYHLTAVVAEGVR
jgi:hypothetical protein